MTSEQFLTLYFRERCSKRYTPFYFIFEDEDALSIVNFLLLCEGYEIVQKNAKKIVTDEVLDLKEISSPIFMELEWKILIGYDTNNFQLARRKL